MRTAAGSVLVALLDATVIALLVGVDALTRKWRRRGADAATVPMTVPAQRVDLTDPDLVRATGRR